MISLDRIRELEPSLKNAPDEDVAIIREQLYGLGHLVFESWQSKSGSKIPMGLRNENDENKAVQ